MLPPSIERRCGLASPAIALGSILLAVALAPWFSWTGDALSDLGAAGRATAPVFNGGLVVAGLLALPFARRLRADAHDVLERIGAALLAPAAVALAGVGAFPTGAALHFPAALAFYFLFTLAMVVHGAGAVRSGATRRGAATVALALLHVASWVVWARGIRLGPGLAIPETVGALIVVVWMAAAAVAGQRRSSASSASSRGR